MEISYYPGCTVKADAKNLENSALPLLKIFDYHTKELDDWYCCGVSYSQSSDNLMQQLAPIRTLIKAKETGNDRLLTLCDMCYNTLKRSALFTLDDKEKCDTIQDFMDEEETKYNGDEIDVLHILSLLKEIGTDRIKEKIVKKADGLKVAPYYGCMILRPKEVAIDSNDSPKLMEEILTAMDCEPISYPFRNECCTSYQIVNEREIVKARTRKLVTSAVKRGAEMIVLSCPLCNYNIDAVQKDIAREDSSFKTLPVLYLTQLLALMMGVDPGVNDFSLHYIDPQPLLKEKGLL
ncbi:MAG: heterodisulfide reductase, subunit B [Candidatus Cloacimonetes bacterium]|nr:heterodisulfide reductase, subunit B [Candidatus Cloacimonadota bacterium]